MGNLDLIFSFLLLRNLFKFILQFDLLPIGSLLIFSWIIIQNKLRNSFNLYFLIFILLIPISGLLGFLNLSNTISLNNSEVTTRVIFNNINMTLTLFSLYKIYTSKFENVKIKYAFYIVLFILFGASIQLIFPFFDKDSFIWLFNTNATNYSLRGFANESGILCQILIILLVIEEKYNSITKFKRYTYILASYLTNSTLFFVIPTFYIIKKIKSIKNLILSIIFLVTFIFLSISLNLFSLFEKITLLSQGGGDNDLGGRYLSNLLIIQNIFNLNSISQFFFGNGTGSYHSILENYLNDLGIITFSALKEIPYDYGGSDILIFLNDFGLIGFLIFSSIIFFFIKSSKKRWDFDLKKNTLYSSRAVSFLLIIKGMGLYSPFALFLLLITFV